MCRRKAGGLMAGGQQRRKSAHECVTSFTTRLSARPVGERGREASQARAFLLQLAWREAGSGAPLAPPARRRGPRRGGLLAPWAPRQGEAAARRGQGAKLKANQRQSAGILLLRRSSSMLVPPGSMTRSGFHILLVTAHRFMLQHSIN